MKAASLQPTSQPRHNDDEEVTRSLSGRPLAAAAVVYVLVVIVLLVAVILAAMGAAWPGHLCLTVD